MSSVTVVDDVAPLKRSRDGQEDLESPPQPKHARVEGESEPTPLETGEVEDTPERSVTQFFIAANNHVAATKIPFWSDLESFQVIPAVWAERGVRRFMEDTHLICPSILKAVGSKFPSLDSTMDAAIFAIFDGHGGRQTATFARDRMTMEIASQIIGVYEEFFAPTSNVGVPPIDTGNPMPRKQFAYTDKVVEVILKRAFLALDARLEDPAMKTRDGCVAVVAFLPFAQQASPSGPCMYVASLGDAAALLARQKSLDVNLPGGPQMNAISINEIHRPWDQSERARIYRKGGTVESGRVNGVLEVSRSFGDFPLKRFGVSVLPTVSKFRIDPLLDHFVLLGCDGFWSNWTAIESINKVASLLLSAERRQEPSSSTIGAATEPDDSASLVSLVQNVCREAVEFVLIDKRTQDNVSLMILKFRSSMRPAVDRIGTPTEELAGPSEQPVKQEDIETTAGTRAVADAVV